jgi:methionyl-tRNA formyltransferase
LKEAVGSRQSEVGHFETDNKTYLYIKTLDGYISVEEFQPEGKKRMKVDEFFRGNQLVVGKW